MSSEFLFRRRRFPHVDPAPRYKVVRGALDFAGVPGRMTARSRYGYVCLLLC